MPTINIAENIKRTCDQIEKISQEVFRLQGVLNTFEGLQKGGLTVIELPKDPNPPQVSDEELKSIQEKPE
jgi:hypothetical protein